MLYLPRIQAVLVGDGGVWAIVPRPKKKGAWVFAPDAYIDPEPTVPICGDPHAGCQHQD